MSDPVATNRIVVIGGSGYTHLGESFTRAAAGIGFESRLVDIATAYQSSRLVRAIYHRFFRGAPSSPNRFRSALASVVQDFRPSGVLSTGLQPVSTKEIDLARSTGARIGAFLSDDPYNPKYRTRRFFRALPHFDVVFSPRTSNLDQLQADGAKQVVYLPFAYDPIHFYPTTPAPDSPRPDLVFVGGADPDRLPYLLALEAAGFEMELYGAYWQRYKETKRYAKSIAQPDILRDATARAKVNLCLVRRANRDGHVMRTFEIAACGGCLLAEDTPEHRALLGSHAAFFDTPASAVARMRELLGDPARRKVLGEGLRKSIAASPHTYADRLATIMSILSPGNRSKVLHPTPNPGSSAV